MRGVEGAKATKTLNKLDFVVIYNFEQARFCCDFVGRSKKHLFLTLIHYYFRRDCRDRIRRAGKSRK